MTLPFLMVRLSKAGKIFKKHGKFEIQGLARGMKASALSTLAAVFPITTLHHNIMNFKISDIVAQWRGHQHNGMV